VDGNECLLPHRRIIENSCEAKPWYFWLLMFNKIHSYFLAKDVDLWNELEKVLGIGISVEERIYYLFESREQVQKMVAQRKTKISERRKVIEQMAGE